MLLLGTLTLRDNKSMAMFHSYGRVPVRQVKLPESRQNKSRKATTAAPLPTFASDQEGQVVVLGGIAKVDPSKPRRFGVVCFSARKSNRFPQGDAAICLPIRVAGSQVLLSLTSLTSIWANDSMIHSPESPSHKGDDFPINKHHNIPRVRTER